MARKAEFIFVGDAASIVKAAEKAANATKTTARVAEESSNKVGAAAAKSAAASTRGAATQERVHVRMRKSFAGLSASAAKMGAGVVAAYASFEGVKGAVEATDDLAKTTISLHKNLGLTVEQASRWGAVAKARGIDTKALTQAFGTLSKNAVSVGIASDKQKKSLDALGKSQGDLKKGAALAAKGLGPQAQAFKDLGLSTKDVAGANKDFQGFLGKVADGFGKLHGGSDKAALGMKLFGKGWQTVLPVLRSGSKAMDDQLKLADKYGVTLHGKSVKSIEEMVSAQRESKFATLGLQVAVGQQLIPTITKGIQTFSAFVANLRNGGGGFAKFRADIRIAVTEIKTDFAALVAVAGPVVSKLVSLFQGLPRPVKIAAAAIAGLGLVMAVTSPLGAAIAAFAIGAVLIKRNWSSIAPVIAKVKAAVTGWVTQNRADINVVIKAFKDVANVLKTIFVAEFNYALAVVKRAMPGIKAAVTGAIGVIKGVLNVFLGVLHGDWGRVWDGLKGIASGALKGVLGAIRAMTAPAREAMSRVGSAIVGVFHDLGGRFIQLGENLLKSLASGIVNGAKAAVDAVGNAATSVVNKAKGIFHIGSPSKVFTQIGAWLAQGLAEGIAGGKGMVDAAVKSGLLFPIEAAITALQGEETKLQGAFDKADARRQRAGLVQAIRDARNAPVSGSGIGGTTGGGTFTPHGGSTGFFPGSGTNYSKGDEPTLAARLDALAKALKVKLTGVSGYRTPAHSVAVGGFADDPHTKGKASDTPGTERIPESTLRKFGLTRPFGGAKEADHIQLLPGFKGSTRSGKGGVSGGAVTPTSFAHSVLSALGIKATAGNMKGLVGWAAAEGGNWKNNAKFNPFNTTLKAPGAKSINSVGVKAYTSWQQGLDATIKTLKSGKYGPILAALRSGDPMAIANAIGNSKWGTSLGLARSAISGAQVGKGGGTIGTGGSGGSSGNSLSDALKALKDFDREQARTQQLSKIDLKIQGLQALNAAKQTITDLKGSLKDLASQAGEAFATSRNAAIDAAHDAAYAAADNNPELAGLLAQDKKEQDDRSERDLKKAVTDAQTLVNNSGGQTHTDALQQLSDAQKDLDAFYRKQREDKIQDDIDAAKKSADGASDQAKAGVQAETDAYVGGLQDQFNALTASLSARRITFAQFAKDVRGILAANGLDPNLFTPTPDQEASVSALGTKLTPAQLFPNSLGAWGHRAAGGPVMARRPYVVGEKGPEVFVPGASGTIIPNGKAGGTMVHVENLNVRRPTDVTAVAHKLAFKLAH